MSVFYSVVFKTISMDELFNPMALKNSQETLGCSEMKGKVLKMDSSSLKLTEQYPKLTTEE